MPQVTFLFSNTWLTSSHMLFLFSQEMDFRVMYK